MDRADTSTSASWKRGRRRFSGRGAAARIAAGAGDQAVGIFRSQCTSRHLDRMGRRMQKAGQGYYTIGSSGHEGMAAVAAALRPTDMAFLHYRDAAFQIERASRSRGQDIIRDMLLSFACSTEDPISAAGTRCSGPRR
jgi:2-oxoisovalerate dehydrogenase E1 component